MIVVALATSISATGLPLITEAVTLKNHRELARLISNNLQLFVFVMLPATFGMIVFSATTIHCFLHARCFRHFFISASLLC